MAATQTIDFPATADHHLWRNGRLWWVAFTVHLPPWQKERVRLSLGTDDLAEARRRRDELLRRYPHERGCTLSLRPGGRRAETPRHNRARLAARCAVAPPAPRRFDRSLVRASSDQRRSNP